MKVLAVDDEKLILGSMLEDLAKVFPDADIHGETTAEGALKFLEESITNDSKISYAFLDIHLGDMSGVDVAKIIKEKSPATKIIFCTAYSEYACEAFKVHATGYLLKPVSAKDIEETLDAMEKDWRDEETPSDKEVRVQTFGNFEVFADGEPVTFEREKSKELLAFLVDRRGAAVTSAEIAAVLWEDKFYDRNVKNQTTVIISSLKKSLKAAGIGGIIIKTWNHIAIDTSKIKCDLYDFYHGDALAVNSYHGEYLANYSWAEMTNGVLVQKSGLTE
ncbi:MAG: response regulator [Lachnospiraceae bacterium]|nr:response regulator [Lachnospiraceae bacterium]